MLISFLYLVMKFLYDRHFQVFIFVPLKMDCFLFYGHSLVSLSIWRKHPNLSNKIALEIIILFPGRRINGIYFFSSLYYFIFRKLLFLSCLVIPGVFLIRIILPCMSCLKVCIIGKLSNVYSYKRPSNKPKIDIVIVPKWKTFRGWGVWISLFSFQ